MRPAGNKTCQSYPGSFGHETADATLYKSWNVTYVKNDWCWRTDPAAQHLAAFNVMRDALNVRSMVNPANGLLWFLVVVFGRGVADDSARAGGGALPVIVSIIRSSAKPTATATITFKCGGINSSKK